MVCNYQTVKFSLEGKNKQKLTSLQIDKMSEQDVSFSFFFVFFFEGTT